MISIGGKVDHSIDMWAKRDVEGGSLKDPGDKYPLNTMAVPYALQDHSFKRTVWILLAALVVTGLVENAFFALILHVIIYI